MSKKENIRNKYDDNNEDEEQTYNNFESFKGLISDVKQEDGVDKDDEFDENFSEEEKEQESDSDRGKRKKKLTKRSKKRKESEDYEEDYDDDEDEESEDEYDEESDFSERYTKKKRARGKKNKKRKTKRRKRGVEEFFEQEAESDEEEESEVEGEITKAEQEQLTKKLYEKKDKINLMPARKRLEILDQNEEEIRQRYEGMEDEAMDHENFEQGDIIGQQGRQPSISDPKLWLVKCRPGKEKECVENLYHKYFSVKNEEERIKILSACTFEALKGYIYVEAFKEANVREAVQGISALRENSVKIVPLTEMTQVFNFDKIQKIDLKPKQWVRLKSGLYEGDLAQVITIEDPINKIYVRLVPRISEDTNSSQKKDTIGDYSKKLKKSVRPRQKLFNPQNYSDVVAKSHPVLRDTCYMWNKMSFKDGFLIKSVKAKSLITEDVVPKIEELRLFDLMKMKSEGQQIADIDNLISTIQETDIASKKKKFAKGDKVKIIKGGLKSVTGRVDSHSNGVVRMIGDIEGVNDILELPEDYVVKDFLPGDLVKVINGPHIGKHGLIVRVDDGTVHIFSESTMSEFKASSHDIVSSTYQMNETELNPYFQLGDLVKISGTNNVGYVLDVQQYSLKLIDIRSEIRNVSVREVSKLTQIKPNGIDSKRNPITKDDTIKVINGPYKGKRAVIRNIYRNFCFLYNQDFVSTNGIFVDNTQNLEIMGSELLSDNYNMSGGRVNYKRVPEELRQMIGKTIKIIKGNWKGYIGILKKVTDKNAMVELSSKNKTISVDLSCIMEARDDNSMANQTYLTTPRSNTGPKTPAYYPQSPSFNPTSPSWNPSSTPAYYLQANSPNPRREGFMSPGSNYK